MNPKNFLNNLAENLSEVLPTHLNAMKIDAKKNFHAVLQNAFDKLDVVTREEFDAQTKVLARSREKIDELVLKVNALEKIVNKNL